LSESKTDILSSSFNQQANIVSSELLMSSTIYMTIRLEKLQKEDQPQSDEKRMFGLIFYSDSLSEKQLEFF